MSEVQMLARFVVVTAAFTLALAAAAAPKEAPQNSMANCPSGVDGAVTAVADVDGGVEVIITGVADGVAQIRARAKALVDASKSPSKGKHDQKGHGGGKSGRCPVVMWKTSLATADVEGGAKLTVKAEAPGDVAWLRKETRERLDETAAANAGHGKMGHCPSAIDGAATKLTDTKEGVVVTITGAGPAIADIRARTRDLLAAVAKPDTGVGHTGTGEGRGVYGRCPVVVQETTLSAKDVDGGSEITVKANSPGAVAALQKEAHARAERLAPHAK